MIENFKVLSLHDEEIRCILLEFGRKAAEMS